MPESLGVRLRQRREEQQIALASIAERTKISVGLLEALERGDVSHWPGGIFRRAFVRAYAETIGLDPDVVVREFLELFPDPNEEAAAISALAGNGAQATRPPPTGFRALATSLFGSLVQRRSEAVPQLPFPAARRTETVSRAVSNPKRRLDTVPQPVATFEPQSETVPETAPEIAANPEPLPAPPEHPPQSLAPAEPDFAAAARVCGELGRLRDTGEAAPLLGEIVRILDAVGVIVWGWIPQLGDLRPIFAHGYSDRVLALLPKVRREADNATASAFRSAELCVVKGCDPINGAVAVPLMTADGCVGVFAIELRPGGEQRPGVQTVATIFAAQLAVLIGTLAEVGTDAVLEIEPHVNPLSARA